jgi:chromosome segregation ATPase
MPATSPAAPTAAPSAGLSPAEHQAIRAIADRNALANIQRKLDRWELQHLREHAAHLATQAEQLEGQLQLLQARLEHAEQVADYWREQVLELQADLGEDLRLGMTVDGQMGLVSA